MTSEETFSLPALTRRIVNLRGPAGRRPLSGSRHRLRSHNRLLSRLLRHDLTLGRVAVLVVHASVGPTVPGGALLSGAGTTPTGGVPGAAGRAAARTLPGDPR